MWQVANPVRHPSLYLPTKPPSLSDPSSILIEEEEGECNKGSSETSSHLRWSGDHHISTDQDPCNNMEVDDNDDIEVVWSAHSYDKHQEVYKCADHAGISTLSAF